MAVFVFAVDFAKSKDDMTANDGVVCVEVQAGNRTEARLIAEQMVAALGVEPIGIEEIHE